MAAAAAALAMTVGLAVPASASSVDEAVVDVTTPVNAVSLEQGASHSPITITLTVTGNQDGTATFDVYQDWTLAGGVFTGSNPVTETIAARAQGASALVIPLSGTVSVAANQALGIYTLAVKPFNITNSNQQGGKLAAGQASNYQVTVIRPTDATPPVLNLPSDTTVDAVNANGAIVSYTVSANDAVDGPITPICSPASGTTFPIGTTHVSCSATDKHNNTAQGSFNVVVSDKTAPVVAVPADITVEATGSKGAVVTYGATASDAIDGTIAPGCNVASGSIFALGVTTVTCSATDKANNTGTAAFTVTVTDTTPPTLTLSNAKVEATGPTTPVDFGASAADLVDGVVPVTCDHNPGSNFPVGDTTVTCSATDKAGHTATSTLTVTVTDTKAPALPTLSDFTAEATGPDGAIVNYGPATATDLVDGDVAVVFSPASGSTLPLGTNQVSYTATDAHGNKATTSFNVLVQDTTAPTLSGVPSDITTEATGPNGAAVSFGDATATDLVDGSVDVHYSVASGHVFGLGVTTVDVMATDAHGNTAQESFKVTVVDTTPPAITAPDVKTEATGPNTPVSYTATARDLVDGDVPVTCVPEPGSSFPVDDTTVKCTATDSRGNTDDKSFKVTVTDNTAPTISNVPSDIPAEAAGPNGAAVSFRGASAFDLVDGSVPVHYSVASGSVFGLGATTVHVTATDAHGNSAEELFKVTVVDTTRPVITAPDVSKEATGANTPVSFAPTATDLVDGDVPVICAPASGSSFPVGDTTVDCSASDSHGNIAPKSFKVTVTDNTAPTISNVPSNITAEATGADGATVSFGGASATDLVDGPISVHYSVASGSVFGLGATTVHVTATDAHGNAADKSFTVTVQDSTPPVLHLPSDMTGKASGNNTAAVNYSATASDLVDGSVPVICDHASGSAFSLGTTLVKCSATDSHGNTATGSFKVGTTYDWTGFFQPVDMGNVVNKAKAGQSIPIKFSLHGYQGMNIFAQGVQNNPGFTAGTVPPANTSDDIEIYATSVPGLTYDQASDQYTYVWKTDKALAGVSGTFKLVTADGVTHTAMFTFTK
jgi:hypothetical protein